MQYLQGVIKPDVFNRYVLDAFISEGLLFNGYHGWIVENKEIFDGPNLDSQISLPVDDINLIFNYHSFLIWTYTDFSV